MSDRLPRGWLEVPLEQVAEVRLGRQRSPDKATGEHMRPYMRAANVTWAGVSLDDVKEMNFSPKEFETYELKQGDVLLSEASGSASEVGKPALWRGEVDGCCFQNTLIRVRSRGPLPDYLQLHFLADARLGRFAAAGKGIGINHLGADRMSSWPTRLPPLNEQRRIVAKLEALQARSRRAREALDAVPPLLGKLRQSILAAAFRGDLTKDWRAKHKQVEPASVLLERIRVERRKKWEENELVKMKAKGKAPTDDRWKAKYEEPEPVDPTVLPGLPEGWCWVPLPLLGEVARGKSKHRPRNDARLFGSTVPFIQTGDVAQSAGKIRSYSTMYSPFGLAQSRAFPAGTVCITIAANIASSGILEFESCFPDSVVGFLADGGPQVASFVEFFIRIARADLKRFAPATAQANINLEVLAGVAVPIPPVDELRLIVARVERALGHATRSKFARDAVEARIQALDRSVLAQAFRGELVPQDPNDEPAETMLARLRSPSLQTSPKSGRSRRTQARNGAA